MDVAGARCRIGFHVLALECGDDTPDGVLDDLARARGGGRHPVALDRVPVRLRRTLIAPAPEGLVLTPPPPVA